MQRTVNRLPARVMDQLEELWPSWRDDFECDAHAAALELGLVTEIDELDFSDDDANWLRAFEAADDEEEG